jgi:5-methylcytosine-specific restriction endonuclease McrBC GTP-binding regulatory subunit McrB
MPELHERVVVNQLNVVSSPDDEPKSGSQQDCELELDVPNVLPPEMAHNRILYGAPGTGKSHRIDDNLNTYFPKPDHRQRITFHPDYTYTQFLGSYRPVPVYRNTEDVLLAADKETSVGNHEPLIDYQFVAGPFLRMLVRALTYPTHSFVLVIEELNRANAPAVFGEVFQLLDRGPDGTGKFSVELAPDARDYMRARGLSGRVQLPSNFYIWATMNSADQGVLPLDAAFKRRWSFEYMPLDENNAATESWKIALKFLHTPLNWNDFRKNINAYLASRGVAEDRLLGPFFMREEEMSNEDAFVNKILLYLREDVVRHNPELLFRGGVADLGYGALARSYQAGQNIFIDGISFGFTKGD